VSNAPGERQPIGRTQRTITVGGALAILAAAVVWHFSVANGRAQSPGFFFGFVGTVVPDTAHGTTSLSAPSAPGAFSQLGIISGSSDGSGVLRRQGFKFADNSVVVNDQYDLTSFNGAITAQGTLTNFDLLSSNIQNQEPPFVNGQGTSVLGITSGVGTFRFNFGGVVQLTPVAGATDGSFIMRASENISQVISIPQ
jgi:hypothetical protein